MKSEMNMGSGAFIGGWITIHPVLEVVVNMIHMDGQQILRVNCGPVQIPSSLSSAWE